MSKTKWFKDGLDGVQLHVDRWHSDDGGETWWTGDWSNMTRKELRRMAERILQEVEA